MENDFIVWFDDSNTASPEEVAKYPLTEEEERRLNDRLKEVFREFGLDDEEPAPPPDYRDVAKYILEHCDNMTAWKLQKLLYYAQAWHYTWTGERIIRQDFRAWGKGPVLPELYALHNGKYWLTAADFDFSGTRELPPDIKNSIDIMLEHYGKMSGDELVELTHSEEPWLKARGTLPADAHCDEVITVESMGEYYRKHLI